MYKNITQYQIFSILFSSHQVHHIKNCEEVLMVEEEHHTLSPSSFVGNFERLLSVMDGLAKGRQTQHSCSETTASFRKGSYFENKLNIMFPWVVDGYSMLHFYVETLMTFM